jgi:hypothetical protein
MGSHLKSKEVKKLIASSIRDILSQGIYYLVYKEEDEDKRILNLFTSETNFPDDNEDLLSLKLVIERIKNECDYVLKAKKPLVTGDRSRIEPILKNIRNKCEIILKNIR